MNNRGSHADWAISMGIFLVYLLILFIIIRPGIEPVRDEKVLLDIVEQKFSEEVKWVVKMSPLIIKTCSSGAKSIVLEVKDEKNAWEFRSFTFNEDPPNEKEGYCADEGNTFVLTCGGENNCPAATNRIFYLYYVLKSKFNNINPKLGLDCSGGDDCKAELGASENLEGVNSEWLNDLGNANYTEIKKKWDFPESSGFSITVDDNEVIGGEPYEEADVFVKEWTDLEVDNDGEREEIKVNIKVW